MPEIQVVALVGAVFLLAGGVKGVVGLGLPTVSLCLLTLSFGLAEAISLMLVPAFVTNIWQAVAGPYLGMLSRRLWPFLGGTVLTIFVGAEILSRVDLDWLTVLLGALTAAYGLTGLMGFRLRVTRGRERWAGPLSGTINGVFTGMTGISVIPGVMYLQGIGLSRDELVQAMGLLFSLSIAVLSLALGGQGILTAELGITSAIGVIPSLAGMWLGQRLRSHLSEATFRRALFAALLVLGGYIILRSVG